MLLIWGFSLICSAYEGCDPPRISEAPVIDGILNERIWDAACEVTGLRVIDPDNREPASLTTRFKILYDDTALYIGAINVQTKETQIRRLTARDIDSVERDAIRVVLDPSGQGLYGYIFEVALGGSLTDGTIRPEREISLNWDGPWLAVTSSDEDRWYAEMKIPWNMMEFADQAGKRDIGLYLQRDVAHLGQIWAIPGIPFKAAVFLSDFALMPVTEINPKGRLTLYPYVVAGYDSVAGKTREQTGLDLFWQPVSDVLISAAVNPDFGDVENDEVEVNFTATETLFQEKRSFFVEGNDIFETKGLQLVHTRRIGQAPDPPDLAEGESVSKPLLMSDIIAAAKVTGQKNGLRYGWMSAVEDDSDYTINNRYEKTVSGRDYHTARLLYEPKADSFAYLALGYLGTFTGHGNYDAWVHSFDGQWLSREKRFRVEMQAAKSDVAGDRGYALNGKFVYYPAPTTEAWLQLDYTDDQFKISDFGYLERNDRLNYHLEYLTRQYDLPKLKELTMSIIASGEANSHLLETKIGGKLMLKLFNLKKYFAEIYYIPETWDDLNSFSNGIYRKKAGYDIYLSWYSDESKPFHVYINPQVYTEDNGGLSKKLRVRIKLAPLDQWHIETEISYYKKQDWILWQKKDNRMDGFDADQLHVRVDSNYKISSAQELRLGLQWVGIDAIGKTAYRIGPDGHLNRTTENATESSFDYAQFVCQLRYKYEIAPLSDLFIVYNRGALLRRGEDAKQDDLNGLFTDSLDEKDVDTFLIKLRYRF